ncbi:heme exporter protein CcmD [Shewanella surugensis]|uniref:Heme exporter protein D n=1 Tax=Shewanella surugensis TaxID=212020 RepID=A0ABT0LE12_9GAMM|nr:heme exporter protein CcmD [Shewanella surugensis]MCL1125942.1 heme exporter protein CcmD [Shewanella surugensis]
MQFHNLSDFFNMGGYAFYVWLSYGVTFISFGLLIALSRYKKQKTFQDINKKTLREQLLKSRRSDIK